MLGYVESSQSEMSFLLQLQTAIGYRSLSSPKHSPPSNCLMPQHCIRRGRSPSQGGWPAGNTLRSVFSADELRVGDLFTSVF